MTREQDETAPSSRRFVSEQDLDVEATDRASPVPPPSTRHGAAPAEDVIAETRALYKTLHAGATPTTILHHVDLSIRAGEFVALTGASGSGKSTLLYLLGALDRQTSGEVWLDGVEMGDLDDDDRAAFRNERLGFVFQFHFLLPEFDVLENVAIPMMRRGIARAEAEDRAYETLGLLGLEALWKRRPGQISGGQQQRVSIARAVANDPTLVLADEPTGNLDSHNAALVFDVFGHLAHDQGRTIVMVTHDVDFAHRTDRQIKLRDGRVVEDVVQRRD
jgi:lipoprotein-releasing system ATP-binding protein